MTKAQKKYIEERNSFIPIAESYANEIAGTKPKATGKHRQDAALLEYNERWNAAFHGKMAELWRNRKSVKLKKAA